MTNTKKGRDTELFTAWAYSSVGQGSAGDHKGQGRLLELMQDSAHCGAGSISREHVCLGSQVDDWRRFWKFNFAY